MKDSFFFPLALLAAALLVAGALAPGIGKLPTGPVGGAGTDYSSVVVAGSQLNKIVASNNAEIERIGDPLSAVRISASAEAASNAPRQNPHFELARDLEVQFSGFEMTVTLRAKPADIRGASAFEAAYLAGAAGESGWQRFTMQPGWRDYSFTYRVPVQEGNGLDYLAIRPVVPEKTRAIDVERISFQRGARQGG